MKLINPMSLTLADATNKCVKSGTLKVPHLFMLNGIVYEYIIQKCED